MGSNWRFLALVFVVVFANFHGHNHASKSAFNQAFLHAYIHIFSAPNYSFIQEATSVPQVSFYDYIIIGGGAAGCPLAAALSTQDAKDTAK
ncbi:hypothetical protein V6N13_140639 [Hibiscus sabdariffa]|uniref:Glucose-methanol-choline oxidoreductase N-terminal domain-containing protein n=2 Tax=Hibiscus sabdariffa TaxID=183260 RepID=A0ABR2BL78_9ROSI